MKEKIVEILKDIRPGLDFNQENVNFIEDGMLDSFDLVALISELEATFGITIEGCDVVPENFSSVENIENLLRKKNGLQ